MVFGDLYIFLGIFDDLLAQIVMETAQEVVGSHKPAARLLNYNQFFDCRFDEGLFVLVEFLGICRVYQGAQFLTNKVAGLADDEGQEAKEGLDLLVDDFFVFMLGFEDQGISVFKVFHIVNEDFEVCRHVLL